MFVRILVFYLLAFVFTFVLGGTQQALGIDPLLSALPQWGPGLAGLAMLLIFRKDQHRLNFRLKGVPPAKFLWAVLLPLLAAVVVFPIVWFTRMGFRFQIDLSTPLPLFLASLALGALGEEIGWRGYLHARLDREHRPLVSCLIVGVMWALWHVGFYQNGALYVLAGVVLLTAVTFTMYALLREMDFNLWVASAFHFGVNLANLFYFSVVNQTGYMLLNAVAWTALAAIVALWRRRAAADDSLNDHPSPAELT